MTSFMCSKALDLQPTSSPSPSAAPAARLIAFYLPQFHPTPENDLWWGKGFTEWTNVAKARPLFHGHYQPHVPADLGFYDLRLPEARSAQAAMARAAGIEGFCYWHYWFGGRRMLERPFNEVLRLKEPDFPFCLSWANHSWTGVWHGAPNKTLIEQIYPGRTDYERHFHAILEAFHDPRYIRIRGKPIFVVLQPADLPCAAEFTELWQCLAVSKGLPGIHFVANLGFTTRQYDYRSQGFAAAIAGDMLTVNRLNAWQRSLAWYQASESTWFYPAVRLASPQGVGQSDLPEGAKASAPMPFSTHSHRVYGGHDSLFEGRLHGTPVLSVCPS